MKSQYDNVWGTPQSRVQGASLAGLGNGAEKVSPSKAPDRKGPLNPANKSGLHPGDTSRKKIT